VDLNTGSVLYDIGSNDTVHDSAQSLSSPVADRGKFAMAMQNLHWNCWDARSGKKLWESELTDYPWGNWWPYATASYDFNESKGAIITGCYAGVYAFDWDTGKILWHYADPDVPFESPYGNTPFQSGVRIADGKIYAYNTEHSTSQPITRGWRLYCINATTGDLVWKITGPMSPGPVADGYLTASNSYDGYMYVFGKGKSATTVSAPQTTVAKGTAVLIQGTVLDQSPGQPNTPCVSAASMETQMEYLHMQHPINGIWNNETITGVPVTLTAIGSDGTVIDIGTVTTNGYYGAFGYAWAPPKEDTYTIMASFAGDDSYGSSTAATFLLVGPAPASPTPTPTQPQAPAAPDYTAIFAVIIIAVVVAIIIGIANLLALRRRQ
jgi:outer membrane protein assembly factor BamB